MLLCHSADIASVALPGHETLRLHTYTPFVLETKAKL